MVGIRRPSLVRRGSMENVDMVNIHGTMVLVMIGSVSVKVRRHIGMAASKIDFSWTWNENKKNMRLVLTKPRMKFL